MNLQAPMMIAQIPGDKTRWFVAQRAGSIVSFPATAPPNTPTAVGSVPAVSGKAIQTSGEGGLLSMAFHPKFAQNGIRDLNVPTGAAAAGIAFLSFLGRSRARTAASPSTRRPRSGSSCAISRR